MLPCAPVDPTTMFLTYIFNVHQRQSRDCIKGGRDGMHSAQTFHKGHTH